VLVDTLEAGGAERVAVEVACRLDVARYSPHVLVTRWSGPLEKRLRAAGIAVTVLDRRRRISPRAYRRALNVVRDVDLIHAHKQGSAFWGALLSRVTGVPLLAHEHSGATHASRLVRLTNRRWIGPRATLFVCPSASVAQSLVAHGVPRSRIRVIANGVDFEGSLSREEARNRLGLANDGFVVGIVARLRPEKAHEVLFEAIAELQAMGRDVTTCVVGSGPREPILRRTAATLGIADSVVWSGARADAPALGRAFDVAVVCSDWEGLPLAALEAMAAGVPLVATAVGALPELLRDDAGMLVPSRSPPALAAALARVMDRPDEAAARACRAHQRAERDYGIDAMAATLQDAYGAILSR
jgi:glycosyltransferase involved in cell wall biosynthesis